MVDVFEGEVHLTDEGRLLLATLNLDAPDHGSPGDVTELAPVAGSVADLLTGMDEESLKSRKRGSLIYIPGSQRDRGRLEAIRLLVEAAAPGIPIGDLSQFCCEKFGLNESSARSVVDTLKNIGLVGRTSSDGLAATAAAVQWLTTDLSDDLARIIHSSLFYFGEILWDLDVKEQDGTAKALAVRGSGYMSESASLSKNGVVGRLQLLLALGLVSKYSQSVWELTPRGRMFRESVRCLKWPVALGAPAIGSEVVEPPQSMRDSHEVAKELVAAGLDSVNSRRMEQAVVAAFAYLGLPSRHLGGSGLPDGEVRTLAGKLGQLLAIEAKSSKAGLVQEEFSGLLGLADQRSKINASVTVYVGPGFERRVQEAADADPRVALVSSRLLADLVVRQDSDTLSPVQLAPLLDPELPAEERERYFEELWKAQDRAAVIELTAAEILCAEAEEDWEEEGWMSVKLIRREMRSRKLVTSDIEIERALTFLSSPRIAAIELTQPPRQDSTIGSSYRAVMTLDTIKRRIAAPARQWDRLGGHSG
ncbi:hypothetical protein [Amycolatopsis sp. BJA-103]|uniref:hypothetical protein n=1 Tax=Amycolatopsis sp. BJA-103 TaxID=1911175 RepID=UPI0011AF6342|nr:hypothetical protein [Amycolatopsis sp. BJA-103]